MVKKLSVFFPFYNEQELAEKTIRTAFEVLAELELEDYEILAVENGSTDNTFKILKNLEGEFPKLKTVHLEEAGYGRALQYGFYHARFEWIFFTDSDLQFDLYEIKKLIQRSHRGDLILGYRLGRAEGLLRRLNTALWNNLIRWLLALSVRDIDCAFKLIRKKVIDEIPKLESTGALISAELLVKAKRAGFTFAEVGVHHYPDLAGGSTGANPKVIVTALKELWKFWRKFR